MLQVEHFFPPLQRLIFELTRGAVLGSALQTVSFWGGMRGSDSAAGGSILQHCSFVLALGIPNRSQQCKQYLQEIVFALRFPRLQRSLPVVSSQSVVPPSQMPCLCLTEFPQALCQSFAWCFRLEHFEHVGVAWGCCDTPWVIGILCASCSL